MRFVDLDKNHILNNSLLCDNGFYEYTVGFPLEVTSIKQNHVNEVISRSLSSSTIDDKFMVKYKPNNKIYFSSAFLSPSNKRPYASCHLDAETGCLYIGMPNEFEIRTGTLVFSGYLSLNNYVEEDRSVLCNSKHYNTMKEKVKVLSVGVRGDMLYGLLYIPPIKGLAISLRDDKTTAMSPINYKKSIKCTNYKGYTIKDWFDGTKVKEV